MTPSERDYAALNLPPAVRETYDAYVNDRQAQQLGFTVAKTDARDIALIYHKAVEHAAHIYHDIIAPSGKTVDFEMSIDETLSTTSPSPTHFVVVSRDALCARRRKK